MNVIIIIATAALAENIVLGKMLGLCPFTGLSRRLPIAVGVGAATTAVLTLSAAAAWCIEHFILHQWSLAHSAVLHPAIFIALAACFVQAGELIMRIYAPLLHRMLGVYLPLIATNCAVLAVMLIAVQESGRSLLHATALGFGGGLGFSLAVVCLALLRGRMSESSVPPIMRGAPITMLTAGWMALAFSGLAGVWS